MWSGAGGGVRGRLLFLLSFIILNQTVRHDRATDRLDYGEDDYCRDNHHDVYGVKRRHRPYRSAVRAVRRTGLDG